MKFELGIRLSKLVMKAILLSCLFFILTCAQKPEQKSIGNYAELKQEIVTKRNLFKANYDTSDTELKDSILKLSKEYIFEIITNDIFNNWYGTPWDFNGQTTTPGEGTIACGYFVTTVLRDAGFNIPRVKWAQLASEIFIKKVSSNIKRFSNRPIQEISDYVKKEGQGIYIVGLDTHVGFIYVKGDKMKFVHSNYYQPALGVMEEDFETNNPLNDSKYRVIGKLLDDTMIKNWIGNSRYE